MTLARWNPRPRSVQLRDHFNYHHTTRRLPREHAAGEAALERLLDELHAQTPHRTPMSLSHARAHAELGIEVTCEVDPTPPKARPPRSLHLVDEEVSS